MKIRIQQIKNKIVFFFEEKDRVVHHTSIETDYDFHTFMHLLRTEWMRGLEIVEGGD